MVGTNFQQMWLVILRKPDIPLPVHGIITQSVDLSLPVTPEGSGLEIYWTYQTSILAVYTNNRLKIINDKFMKRLETPDNGATLRINNLRKEDGGIYTVTISDTDGKVYETSYNLTVYDPVPSPVIQTEVMEDTTDRCNVTLHCSVPSITSDLSYTWKYRQGGSEYHLYNNGSTIQISLRNDSRDTEYLCIVHNPADQKNVSYTVQHICPHLVTSSQSKGGKRHHYDLLAILVLLVPLIALLFLIMKKRKSEKRKEEQLQEPKEEPKELQYATPQFQRSEGQRAEPEDKEIEQNGAIVYSTLVHHAV
ncbi:CD48 antigen-like isoform X2 [Dendropsophus ebraccatus]|uniref:CD48 antigen-like isoform X2 n=1 Tax=Dendropsophus ebraccatus TaxID=150705 RepID=UPI00383126A5